MRWWRNLYRNLRDEIHISGRPRHIAEEVRVGICYCRTVGIAALIVNIPDSLLMIFGENDDLFRWGHPWSVAAVKLVTTLALLGAAIPPKRTSIRQAQAYLMLIGAVLVAASGCILGLSHISFKISPVASVTFVLVLMVIPLRASALFGLLLIGVASSLLTAWATGLTAATMRPDGIVGLWPPVAHGVLGIAVNYWLRGLFRARFYADLKLKRTVKEVSRQQSRANRLLDSALTHPIAEHMRQHGSFPSGIHEACVIVCDIVGFSTTCQVMTHRMIVHELNRFFNWFDLSCQEYHVEPLRAEGDSRLAISGLWCDHERGDRNHEIDCILAMLMFRQRLRPEGESVDHVDGQLTWGARIGIHVGPVIMGVVEGVRLCFDVWGDTVNVAARIEQSAQTNQIVVSERVLWCCRELFDHSPIESRRVKNTELPGVSVIHQIRPEYADEFGMPNEAFWQVYDSNDRPVVSPNRQGSGI